jgi:hypothetical protein
MQHVLNQLPPLAGLQMSAAASARLTPIAVWALSMLVHYINLATCVISAMLAALDWTVATCAVVIAKLTNAPLDEVAASWLRDFYGLDMKTLAAVANKRIGVCGTLKVVASMARRVLFHMLSFATRMADPLTGIAKLVQEQPAWAAITLCLCYIAYQHWAVARSNPNPSPAANNCAVA